MKNYEFEKDGQKDFFDLFQIDYINNEVLIENTDGVYNGNLFEFKLNITNLNTVLFQAIKYLSKLRISGIPVPATMILVSLNTETAYIYKSEEYREYIETTYYNSASKNNNNFIGKGKNIKLDYSTNKGTIELQKIIKETNYFKINIDEDCICGWAEKYYRENKGAQKGEFLGDNKGQVKIIGEIRKPIKLKDYILPYTKETNEKFKYLMGRLNDRLNKKKLGAFYTPSLYAKKSVELVLEAIKRIPKENDYIILDRCAGTGNLEAELIGLKDNRGDYIIEHCVLSTFEYYEYKVLQERLGTKVKFIIPPKEDLVKYSNGLIVNADATSKEYIENEEILEYVNNSKCSVILFENPPYDDETAENKNTDEEKKNVKIQTSFVLNELKKELKENSEKYPNTNISTAREIANQFIFSGFKYYVKNKYDSYVLYSPVKYFKSLGLGNKEFVKGFLFNRKHFDASPSAISCILWKGIDNYETDEITLTNFDIKNNELIEQGETIIKKVNDTFKKYFDKTEDKSDIETPVYCEKNGYEIDGRKTDGKSYYNKNILGYLVVKSFGIDNNNVVLTRQTLYYRRGMYLRTNNYLEKLPLFCAKLYPEEKWYEKNVYFTTSDGGNKYIKDTDLLKSSLIYTALSSNNKCISFKGSDKRTYINQLCFDGNTIISKDIKKFKLNDDDIELLELNKTILKLAKKTKKYKKNFSYGIYQIDNELNTFKEKIIGNKKETIYDYPELNGYIISLSDLLKKYYKKYIVKKLFKYELLK